MRPAGLGVVFALLCACGRIGFEPPAGTSSADDGGLGGLADSARGDPWSPVMAGAPQSFGVGGGAYVAWTGDRFAVVWSDMTAPTNFATYSRSGAPLISARPLATTSIAGPLVTVDGELAMIATSTEAEVSIVRFAADGTNLREVPTGAEGYNTTLRLSEDGTELCGGWLDNNLVYVARFDTAGTVVQGPIVASTQGAPDFFQTPQVGCRGDRLYAVWTTQISGSDRIHYAVSGSTTIVAETELPTVTVGTTVQVKGAVLARDEVPATVVFRVVGGASGYGLRLGQFDPMTGGSLMVPELLPLGQEAQLGWSGDRFTLAWEQVGGGGWDLAYASVSSDLSLAETPVTAANDASLDEWPVSIARAPTGEVAIGYQAEDTLTVTTTANIVFLH
jgi:hypothetical protein